VNEPAIVPDVMVSVDVQLPDELWEKKHRSYFMWEYGKPPEIVVEVVSNRKGRELVKNSGCTPGWALPIILFLTPTNS
jgi:Uma2 family endonuclease